MFLLAVAGFHGTVKIPVLFYLYLPHAATSSLSIIHSGLEINESLIKGILFLWRAQSFIFATLQLKFFSFRLSLGTTLAKE